MESWRTIRFSSYWASLKARKTKDNRKLNRFLTSSQTNRLGVRKRGWWVADNGQRPRGQEAIAIDPFSVFVAFHNAHIEHDETKNGEKRRMARRRGKIGLQLQRICPNGSQVASGTHCGWPLCWRKGQTQRSGGLKEFREGLLLLLLLLWYMEKLILIKLIFSAMLAVRNLNCVNKNLTIDHTLENWRRKWGWWRCWLDAGNLARLVEFRRRSSGLVVH